LLGFNPLFLHHLISISFNPLIAVITPLKLQFFPHLTIFSTRLTTASPLSLLPSILALLLTPSIIAFSSTDLKLASEFQQLSYLGSLPILWTDSSQSESEVILLLFLFATQAFPKDLYWAQFFSTFIHHQSPSFALPTEFRINNMPMTLSSS